MHGIHLTRTDENVEEIEALAALTGGRVGLDGLLGDLTRRARRTWAPGRAVHRALTWEAADRRDPRWWPQGISTSADASDTEDVAGHRMLAVSWYAKKLPGDEANHGSRITFLDLATRRYRHVLLVEPVLRDGRLRLEPVRVHAGGIVWAGPWLHVAATARGFLTCRVDDLIRVPDELAGDPARLAMETGPDGGDRIASYGYRYVLPVRFAYHAETEEGVTGLRYSFLSMDRATTPPALVVGEYGRGRQTTRLARFPLDPDSWLLAGDEAGRSRPVELDDGGVGQMQGAVVARGRHHVTVSHGPVTPGSIFVGRPGGLVRHRWAAPMGPEDIAYWPSTDLLWSVTEHPRRRWVFSMRRSFFDR